MLKSKVIDALENWGLFFDIDLDEMFFIPTLVLAKEEMDECQPFVTVYFFEFKFLFLTIGVMYDGEN
jgi:hypothetical protein